MKVKIKKLHPDAVIPKYAKHGDAGMDLVAVDLDISDDGILTYDTGLQFEIPEGYFGLITLRSSVYKTDLMLTNHVGIIDSGYRGNVSFKFCLSQQIVQFASEHPGFHQNLLNGKALFYPDFKSAYLSMPHSCDVYKIGDRIGQIIILPYPQIEFQEVYNDLSETERGSGGYGSTGR